MAAPRIRIKLRGYDHEILDAAARDIVDPVTRTGAKVVGPVPLPLRVPITLPSASISTFASPLCRSLSMNALARRASLNGGASISVI